jgi:glycosyltransferase involved in cell wall biosynthesis
MNTSKSLVTVLMPVYNAEKYLKESIDSILNQTFKDFEFLIIDDGSEDKSVEIIKPYLNEQVRLIQHKNNKGLVRTLNEGLELANGKYIARMDADDIALPKRLELQAEYLERNPGCDFIASTISIINEEGKKIGFWPEDRRIISNSKIKFFSLYTNCVAHPTIMGKKTIFRKYKYNENQASIEDYDLWLRVLDGGNVISKLDNVLLFYRKHASSITQSLSNYDPRVRVLRCKLVYLCNKIHNREFSLYSFGIVSFSLLDCFLIIIFFIKNKIFTLMRL